MPSLKLKNKPRVLIAEDNPNNQELMKMYVKSFGGVPEIVENGKQALDSFKKEAFDIILMDLNMPVLDGFSTSERIRELNPDIPIIAVSVYGEEEIKDKRKKSGINAYVEKPYHRNDLFRAIQRCCEQSQL